ncbi:Palmitoyltransferase PFA3 [Sesbania bispinosa]|nr:Palmitoyltransferase PFA3 [Sesbania bispinosa]
MVPKFMEQFHLLSARQASLHKVAPPPHSVAQLSSTSKIVALPHPALRRTILETHCCAHLGHLPSFVSHHCVAHRHCQEHFTSFCSALD